MTDACNVLMLKLQKRIKARYTQPNDTKYLVELGISDLGQSSSEDQLVPL